MSKTTAMIKQYTKTLLVVAVVSITTSVQAAGLNSLFKNNGASQSKFLPVNQAFQVVPITKVASNGTQLSITFDITPKHYVYKNELTLSFPKGISAAPFTFSRLPVTISDPTFGRVPVFTQNVIATTTLTTTNGKAAKNVPITIGWQGCATAGLCYPPEKISTKVAIAAPRQ